MHLLKTHIYTANTVEKDLPSLGIIKGMNPTVKNYLLCAQCALIKSDFN